MFERKREAPSTSLRAVEGTEVSRDPVPWGLNWPHQLDAYKRTARDAFYGGSSAIPQSKLESHRCCAGSTRHYVFSLYYREARGHAYMVYDQRVKSPQSECLPA